MPVGLFDKTISLLGNALDLRASRHKLLASNIANQETPGYRAVDMNFEKEMKKASGSVPVSDISRTDPRHIPIRGLNGEPRVEDRATEIVNYDQNTVGLEAEMVKLSENTLMYNASAKIIKGKFETLLTAIREGGR